MDAQILLMQIHEHFSRVPYPGDDHIVLDSTGNHLECQDILELLKGRDWHDISFETLAQQRSALSFLSPEGYRFYLPAFMFYSVTDFYRADIIPDEVIQTLTFPCKSDLDQIEELARRHPQMPPKSCDEWEQILKMMTETYASGLSEGMFAERVSGFDAAQCRVIRHFLEYMQDVYGHEFPNQEPQIAIDRYWYRFTNHAKKQNPRAES